MQLPHLRDRDENKQSREFQYWKAAIEIRVSPDKTLGNYFTQTGKLISVHILQFANQND